MPHKPVRLMLLDIAITAAVIALGHALSYLFG